MKHIIVEGPDGSGKSTLIKQLTEDYNITQHARASDSVDGPVPDIYDWAVNDVNSWSGLESQNIYDRHPLISELIYGPICRGKIDPRFLEPEATKLIKKMYEETVIILCLPDLEVVRANLSAEDQMAGVDDNIIEIWTEYVAMITNVPLWADLIVYDYTKTKAAMRLERNMAKYATKR